MRLRFPRPQGFDTCICAYENDVSKVLIGPVSRNDPVSCDCRTDGVIFGCRLSVSGESDALYIGMRDTGDMKISADFTVIPAAFAKAAPSENRIDGTPIVSFPFYIDELDPAVQFLHWEFVDPDSIPVCGFQWNHWALANLPVDALMYDFNDSHALAIPADFSRTVSAMIPETVQGRTSAASPLLKGRSTDPAVTMRYNGPCPPDKDHDYYLHVWGTTAPLAGLNQGFWLNEMERALRTSGTIADQGGVFLTGKA